MCKKKNSNFCSDWWDECERLFGLILALKMKRIKYEEIQNSIQKYVKQRNLSTPLLAANLYNDTDMKGSSRKNSNPHLKNKLRNSTETPTDSNLLTDLNLMALNDLVLIESSLINYYSFSFNSVSDQDYLKQYKMWLHLNYCLNILKIEVVDF